LTGHPLFYIVESVARPKSEEKRNAIMDAATRVIVAQGLSAPIAAIAQEAGVSNGLLFVYFQTKADLFNQLYLDLKSEMATAALKDLPDEASLREKMSHAWSNWMAWAVSHPDKRRALAHLQGYLELTSDTRMAAHKAMAGVGDLVRQMQSGSSLRNISMEFTVAIVNSLTETTMDFMINDPAAARKHCETGFEVLWRALG
jgi:AcrR family transcriptional regulator